MDAQNPAFSCQTRDGRTVSPTQRLFGVAAGFTSTASASCEMGLDLNAYLVRHAAASYYFTVEGDSMRGAGILEGDKLLVDRAIEPRHGHIVVAVVNSEYVLRRLHWQQGVIALRAENPGDAPIHLKEGEALQVWGVVVGVVRKLGV
ncbi:MAG: peptidase [Oxalobacter sp.]|nr:MAG: peptidase [Oxalobacter sp.]